MRRTLRIVLVVLLAAGAIAWFSLDRILKSTIERESTASLRLTTTLDHARLSLLGGKLNLKEVGQKIADARIILSHQYRGHGFHQIGHER